MNEYVTASISPRAMAIRGAARRRWIIESAGFGRLVSRGSGVAGMRS